ncbi:MAG: hypothetical protein HYZ29_22805 [Myxococcales bacterium]|nr:hypothetical protein [Myxococcales bacterium]
MTAPTSDKTAAPASDGSGRGRAIGIGIAAAALALGGAYGTGRYQGMVTTDAAEKRAADREVEKKRATGEFDAQRDRAIRLEARRRLDLALRSVEERNFGVAEQHLAKAKALLARAKGDAALDKLAADIGEAKLPATDDLSAHRDKLRSHLLAFDAALPLAD